MSRIKSKLNSCPVTLKASIAYTVCNIFQKCLGLITMPLFTRLLTQEQYGQYGIYVSWSSIISILLTLNLAYGSFSNAMLKFKNDRNKYISSIQTIVFGLAIVFCVIYFPLSDFFSSLINMPTYLVALMVAEILMQFSIDCWYGLNRFEYKYKSVVIITLIISILSPIFAFILIKFMDEKGEAKILGYALITIIVGFIFLINNVIKSKGHISLKYIKYALAFNLPLLTYYISQVIFNHSDKIMIEHLCGFEKAGIYSIAYTISILLLFVLNSINNAYVPWLYNSIQRNDFYKNRIITIIITIIMCTLVGGLIWIAPEIVYIMAGDKYKEAIYIIPPISISLILLLYCQFLINLLFYDEKKFSLILASLTSPIINIVLNYLLIPKYGYFIAGYTTFISYFVFFVSNYIAVYKSISKKGKYYKIYNIKALMLLLVAFIALSYIGVALYNYFWVRLGIILFVIILLLIFSKKIIAYVKKAISNMKGESNLNVKQD